MKIRVILLLLIAAFAGQVFAETSDEQTPVQIPVLGYHNIVAINNLKSTSNISYEKFKKDLITLQKNGYTTVNFREVNDYVKYGTPLPDNPVMITFDDGYISNYKMAYPLLKTMHMKAVFFVIGWPVGMSAQPYPALPHIAHFSWDQAREMNDSGVGEIESHSYDLHNTGGFEPGTHIKCGYGARRMLGESDAVYTKRIKTDFQRSVSDIGNHVRRPAYALAYPFGVYGKDTEHIAETFFNGTFTVRAGVRSFASPQDLYEIPRILVHENTDVLVEIDKWENPWRSSFLPGVETGAMLMVLLYYGYYIFVLQRRK